MISAARQRALDVLHRRYPMETEIFALYMWPMSPSWRTHRNPRGRGIRLKAGAFLSRLAEDGLAELRCSETGQPLGYVVTPEGERVASTAVPGEIQGQAATGI